MVSASGTGFTPERIQDTLARFRAFWFGQARTPMVSVYTQPAYRQVQEPARMLDLAVACIRQDGASAETDILPCFWPDFGTISTAKMWGGKVIPPPPDGCIHIEPIAKTPADLENLAQCLGAFEESDYQRAIDLYRQLCERLGTDDVFIRTPDFQGPMNTLSLMMDQTELICGMYEAPEMIHQALDHITDVLIARVQRFMAAVGPDKVIGNIWPYLSLPGTMGVCLTQDYMPLLNPELYATFEIPRLKRIADTFGGVWIHCCGVYKQHLQVLKQGNFKIWGLETAYPQMTPMQVYDVFGDDIAYLVGVSPDGAREYPTIIDYAKFLARQDCARARFWFAACHDWVNSAELRHVVEPGFGK